MKFVELHLASDEIASEISNTIFVNPAYVSHIAGPDTGDSNFATWWEDHGRHKGKLFDVACQITMHDHGVYQVAMSAGELAAKFDKATSR